MLLLKSQMIYYHETWVGYLTAIIFKKCNEIASQRCPGCQVQLKSVVLHQHLQFSLFDKLKHYLDEVKGAMIKILPSIYKSIENKLPHTGDTQEDRKTYIDHGMFFLTVSTPESLYWGRYITEENDNHISSLLTTCFKKKFLVDT